ncbi:MAG: AhpC/TSA family protein [Prevotellaceae bacterium]|jgi:thiol-disulfide isomerase/thioredoxin|nr:AhpC/TSA family protein [Prevotellaceae bacterium]
MRKLFPILSVFLLFFACNNTPSSYKITGQVSSDLMEGQTIYLENYLWYMKMSDQKILDSAVIHDKKFEFKGKTDSSYMAVLTIGNQAYATIFVENGNINVDISEEPNKRNIATGTKLNNLFKSYDQSMEPTKKKIDELIQYARSQEITEQLQLEVNQKYDELSKEMFQISVNFLNENPGTVLSAYVLVSCMVQGGLDVELIQSSYDKLDNQVKNSALGNIIQKEIKRANTKEIAEGEIFRDLTLKTPEDKEVSLSDYAGKGKYVLIDFWASWCGPCRAENPNVVALYKEYKNKGLEIVGVSFDNDKDRWIKGIADDGITWPQMSDLKGWESEAAAKYKITGIPFTILLDKEGKVIATNLRGDALKDKIKTLIQ